MEGIILTFTTEQLAVIGALTGVFVLLISIIVAFVSIRRSILESPKIRLDRASAGASYQEGVRFDNATAFAINESAFNLSLTSFYLEIFENRIAWLLRRPTRIARGDGYGLFVEGGQVLSKMTPANGVPITIEAGASARLDLNDYAIWPDKKWRKVYFVVDYRPPRTRARSEITPRDYNFSDPESRLKAERRLAEQLMRQNAE